MSTRARRIALPVVLIVGTMVLLIGVARLTQGPRGPDSSSYATAPRGAGAYAELLARAGHPVRRIRGSLSQTTISAATVIVLDPRDVLPSEVGALRRFLQRGGRVLAGGSPPGAWLRELVGAQAPTWEQGGPTRPGVLARAPETAGVQTIFTDGAGRWTEARGALSLVGDDSGALALVRPVGRGRLVLLLTSPHCRTACWRAPTTPRSPWLSYLRARWPLPRECTATGGSAGSPRFRAAGGCCSPGSWPRRSCSRYRARADWARRRMAPARWRRRAASTSTRWPPR